MNENLSTIEIIKDNANKALKIAGIVAASWIIARSDGTIQAQDTGTDGNQPAGRPAVILPDRPQMLELEEHNQQSNVLEIYNEIGEEYGLMRYFDWSAELHSNPVSEGSEDEYESFFQETNDRLLNAEIDPTTFIYLTNGINPDYRIPEQFHPSNLEDGIFNIPEAEFLSSIPMSAPELYRLTVIKQHINNLNAEAEQVNGEDRYFLTFTGVETYDYKSDEPGFIIDRVLVGERSDEAERTIQVYTGEFAPRQIIDIQRRQVGSDVTITNSDVSTIENPYQQVMTYNIQRKGLVANIEGMGVSPNQYFSTNLGDHTFGGRILEHMAEGGICSFFAVGEQIASNTNYWEIYVPYSGNFGLNISHSPSGEFDVCVLRIPGFDGVQTPILEATDSIEGEYGDIITDYFDRNLLIPDTDEFGNEIYANPDDLNRRRYGRIQVSGSDGEAGYYYFFVANPNGIMQTVHNIRSHSILYNTDEQKIPDWAKWTLGIIGGAFLGSVADLSLNNGRVLRTLGRNLGKLRRNEYSPTPELLNNLDKSLKVVYDLANGFTLEEMRLQMEKEEEFEYKNILESYDSTVDVMRVVEKYFVRIGETYDTIANEKDEETAIRIINEQISNLIETNYPGDDIGNERNHLGEFIERVIRFHDNHKLNEYNAKNRQDSIFRDIIEGYFDDLREKVDYELSLDARKSSAKIYNSEREAAQKIENAFGDIVNIVRADRRIVSEVELIKEYSQAGYSSREISRSDKRKAVKVVSQPTEYEEVEKTDAEIAAEQAVQFIRLLDGVATSDSKKTYEDYTNEFLNNYKKHIHNSRVKKLLVEMVAERVMTKPELIGSTLKSKEKNTLLKDNLGGIIEDILEFISADPGEIAASKDTTLEEGFTGTAKSTMRRKLRYLRNENPELDLKIASKDVYRAKADRRDVRTHIVPITTADGKLFRILPIVTKHSHNKAV